MLITAPTHVLDFCITDFNDNSFIELNNKFGDDSSYVYKIRCLCGNDKFIVYKDNHPTVIAQCCNCKKKITIYDLSFYPAATKIKKEYEFDEIDSNVAVYVNYEYDDEYMYEDDVDFDLNDISWAKVFIQREDKLRMILDDETS